MPRKAVAELDPILKRQIEKEDEHRCFDSLCVLYVAMTRARHGLYMVTSHVGKNARTVAPGTLVKLQLTGDPKPEHETNTDINGKAYVCLHEAGDRNWYKPWKKRKVKLDRSSMLELPADYSKRESIRRRLEHLEPSKQDDLERNAAKLFDPEGRDVLDFGSAIHELFEKVEWAEDADVEGILAEWEPGAAYDEDVTRHVMAQFRACLETDAVRECLARPEGNVECWREKRFDLVRGNEFVSGVFDRVTVTRDDVGKPVRAAIVDYKSSMVEDPGDIELKVRDYTPQMRDYRKALSAILGLPETKIDVVLLFTRGQQTRRL
jgi:ATP-dependent helicase/nuclease subunit A